MALGMSATQGREGKREKRWKRREEPRDENGDTQPGASEIRAETNLALLCQDKVDVTAH